MATVQETTYALLRDLGLTTIFGNPGSTEEPFLKNFPADFTYVLGLHEAAVVAMADGYAQATGEPSLVNLHTSAGLGNALGNLMTAFQNKTPMIVTAGQQTREMLLLEPWLANVDAEAAPKPWVKWSYQPARAEDVPAAFMRAYATAVQAPQGPVFLSLPMDDWARPSLGPAQVRRITRRTAPDPAALRAFAARIGEAQAPLLVLGAAVDRAGAWADAIALAEKLQVPVWCAPACDRTPFPEDHPQFQGNLPFAIAPLCEKLRGHDLVVVIGAPVFAYYPYVPGAYLPEGTDLLHITDDPGEAARAPVGDVLLADAKLALAALAGECTARPARAWPARSGPSLAAESELTGAAVFATLMEVKPANAAMMEECPSNRRDLHAWWPITQPASFFTASSGGIGWGMPAAVGIALGDRAKGRARPVVTAIGDGSFQYTPQALWSAVQHKLPVVFLALRNNSYAILQAFAASFGYTGVPGCELPGLDMVSIARGYGCRAVRAGTRAEVKAALMEAFASDGPTVIEVPIKANIPKLN